MGRALNVIGVPTGAATFSAALEGLTALDEQLLRENPGLPRLYEAGISYTAQATSRWRNVLDVLASKSGDCEALAPWRAAELRHYGEDPGAHVLVYPSGTAKFHAVVMHGDGSIEDPSVLLGMKAPPGLVDNYNWWNAEVAPRIAAEQPAPPTDVQVLGFDDEDAACVGIGLDHSPGVEVVTFDVIGTDEGYRGQFRVPFVDGRALYGVSSTSATEGEAEQKATRVLGFVGSLWDDLAAIVPGPQAAAAIRIARNDHVQNLAKAAYGKAKSVIHPGSGGSTAPPIRRRMPTAAFDTPDSALLDQSVDDELIAPSPFDDQQPLADVDTFHVLPPGGLDAELAPDTISGVPDREDAIIGYINAALVSGSRPARQGGAQRRGGAQQGGGAQQRRGGQQRGGQAGQQRATSPQQQGGGGFGYTPPLAPPPAPFAPGGGGFGSAPGPGAGGGRGGRAAGGQWNQQTRDQQQRDKQQQQQQGGGGGGDSGGGGGGAPPAAAESGTDIDAFFAMGPGGQMGDDAFQQAAQLARQVDQFEGNAAGDGYVPPSAADVFHGDDFGRGMSDQDFADASAFAQAAYQQEGSPE